jgi:hypothetical protein
MDQLNPPMVIAIVAGIVVILAVAVLMMSRRRKHTADLQGRYGAAYDAKVQEIGARKAESELDAREKRFHKAQIQDLSQADRDRYAALWQSVQSRFVDSPSEAVAEADRLVADVMRLRGYPAADFEQRLADVAVGHPSLLEHYREACDIATRRESDGVGTEDLRRAMVHYRALFEELLGVPDRDPAEAADREALNAPH